MSTAPAARTLYLTTTAAPGDLGLHLAITHIPGTLAAQVRCTNPETREVIHNVTVLLSVIDRSIVNVPTRECSSGFVLHAGRLAAGICFKQICTIRRWTETVIEAAAA